MMRIVMLDPTQSRTVAPESAKRPISSVDRLLLLMSARYPHIAETSTNVSLCEVKLDLVQQQDRMRWESYKELGGIFEDTGVWWMLRYASYALNELVIFGVAGDDTYEML